MRNKRLTRKEKIALSGGEQPNEIKDVETVFNQIPPEEAGIVDKKIAKRVLVYSQEDAMDDSFIPPKAFYFINAFGHHIYVATNRRDRAQEISDICFGKNKYMVKKVIKAVTR